MNDIPTSNDGQAENLKIQSHPAPEARESAFHGGPVNILIVDDEPKNLTVLETVLDNPGYRLVRAESGEQALLALVAEEFALLILDIRMPNMTGLELAQMIKERKKTAQVPIIFLTAYYNEDQHVLEGYGTGAVDYLQKPLNPSILRSKVAVFTDLYRKNRECEMANSALLAEVTERRRVDEELIELNNTLEQRVIERTEALRESEGKFRALLETAPDSIVIVDQQGIIVLTNALTERLFGYNRTELLGQRVKMLMPARFHSRQDVHREGYLAGAHTRGMGTGLELLGQRKDGSEFPIEVSFSPLETAQGTLISSAIRDITERKQGEKMLQEEKQKAEAANQAKSNFLANMSHEIRTPMNAIIGLSHILLTTTLDDKQKHFVGVLQTSADRLMVLINDLLDIDKIEAEVIELDHAPFNLTSLLEGVISVMSVRALEKGVKLNVQYEAGLYKTFIGDSGRIRQIVLNLVGNAVKFTDQGGVSIFLANGGGGNGKKNITISVKDTGIGIPENKIADIFGKFIQADSSITRRYGGTGLGLTISKSLAEQMGGSITVTSEVGVGSTFTLHLSLPVGISENCKLSYQENTIYLDTHKNASQLPILLVEDYEANILVATTMLESFGYRFEVARNGQEAIDKFSPAKYSLILLDVEMPLMDGFEVTRHIRGFEKVKKSLRVPIIAMTAHALKEDREKCISKGMDDYIAKPFNPHQLQAVLIKYLTKSIPPKIAA